MGIDWTSYGTPRAELGKALEEYQANAETYIATKVFPITRVKKQAAVYAAVTRESLMARAASERAKRSNYNRVGLITKDKSYSCIEHGLEGQLDASERALYASDFDAGFALSKSVLDKILREQEIRAAAIAMSETSFDASTCFSHCSAAWTTNTTDIVKDVQAAAYKVFTACGMMPNTLVLPRAILTNAVMINTAIKAAIQYVQMAGWNAIRAALASIIGIPNIIIGDGVYNASPEGATACVPTSIWGSTYALVCITAAGDDPIQPSCGRTFLWTEDSPENVMVESYIEPQTRSEIFRVRQNTDEELIDKNFGCLIDTTATS